MPQTAVRVHRSWGNQDTKKSLRNNIRQNHTQAHKACRYVYQSIAEAYKQLRDLSQELQIFAGTSRQIQTDFSASRMHSSSVCTAKSACSLSIKRGGESRSEFSPAPSTSNPL